jgi:hypothetical protein
VTTPYPPPAAQPASDRSTLFGVLGIVLGFLCCWILGIVFGILSMNEAKKVGKQPTLAYIAFAAAALNLIGSIAYYATR